ncbi:MAG: trimethylamine methyltransferase family protein, partial [Rhizobiaceae bacterium]|nr:trimethylamine methyltransferase family protein [Rhizobiaceae bacterium]
MSVSEDPKGDDLAAADIATAAPAPRRSARAGGRQARREMRAAPLTEDIKPVRPGLSGDTYKPLSDADVEKVHEAVLDVLENIG